MTEKRFDHEVSNVCDTIKEVLSIKAKEYRRNNNPLHNFDVGVAMSNGTSSREEIIYGMALKHIISIQDIRNDVKNGKLPSTDLLNEKYGDAINYLILEKASIIDKIEQNHQILPF